MLKPRRPVQPVCPMCKEPGIHANVDKCIVALRAAIKAAPKEKSHGVEGKG